ncbi:MAG: hypothetical protein Q7T20_09045 [Saprospiraceae bacterium]|nr:hypothetical protein [Saprospiraceae bacterium]
MNIRAFFLLFALLGVISIWPAYLIAQPQKLDSRTTLQWAEAQAIRVESLLKDAMREVEPYYIVIRLTNAYQAFDAVASADLYCIPARSAAESGRKHTDVINYRLGKDLNSVLQRTVEARQQATKMGQAARACQAENAHLANTENEFSPSDILRYDALLAELDLSDGLASASMQLLSQKLDHAIRLLHDVEHLAGSMSDCQIPLQSAEEAVLNCQQALAAPNWEAAQKLVRLAMANLKDIQQSADCN